MIKYYIQTLYQKRTFPKEIDQERVRLELKVPCPQKQSPDEEFADGVEEAEPEIHSKTHLLGNDKAIDCVRFVDRRAVFCYNVTVDIKYARLDFFVFTHAT